jgi:hypothetical protein
MTTDTRRYTADGEIAMAHSATRLPQRAGAAESPASALLYTALPGYGLDQVIATYRPRLAHTAACLP